MTAKETKKLIQNTRFIPILRTPTSKPLLQLAKAVSNANIPILELTTTIPNIFDSIEKIKNQYPSLILGVGTVTTPEQAKNAIESGADFIVSPAFLPNLCDTVKEQDKMLILAGLTPTEIYQAYLYGSNPVKVFPAGGINPNFIKDIHGPFPQIELLPTGGLSLIEGLQYLEKGAFAVGLGGSLFNQKLIAEQQFEVIEAKLKNAKKRIELMKQPFKIV